MKNSSTGVSWRKLKAGQIVRVTNTRDDVTARFLVDTIHLWFLPFIKFRVLSEISIGAAFSGEFFFVRDLRNKNLQWEVIENAS